MTQSQEWQSTEVNRRRRKTRRTTASRIWCAPWRIAIPSRLWRLKNKLKIEVPNVWANRLIIARAGADHGTVVWNQSTMKTYLKSLIRTTLCVTALNYVQAASLNFERASVGGVWTDLAPDVKSLVTIDANGDLRGFDAGTETRWLRSPAFTLDASGSGHSPLLTAPPPGFTFKVCLVCVHSSHYALRSPP